jgi:hypothetical protein
MPESPWCGSRELTPRRRFPREEGTSREQGFFLLGPPERRAGLRSVTTLHMGGFLQIGCHTKPQLGWEQVISSHSEGHF